MYIPKFWMRGNGQCGRNIITSVISSTLGNAILAEKKKNGNHFHPSEGVINGGLSKGDPHHVPVGKC